MVCSCQKQEYTHKWQANPGACIDVCMYAGSAYLLKETTSFVRPKIVGYLGGLSKEGLLHLTMEWINSTFRLVLYDRHQLLEWWKVLDPELVQSTDKSYVSISKFIYCLVLLPTYLCILGPILEKSSLRNQPYNQTLKRNGSQSSTIL